jgi:hypothetical protein
MGELFTKSWTAKRFLRPGGSAGNATAAGVNGCENSLLIIFLCKLCGSAIHKLVLISVD